MPDFRQAGTKPLRPHDSQGGLDVKLESKTLENDTWAQTTLKDIGKTMTPGGDYEYLGSIAVHWYSTKSYDVLVPNGFEKNLHTMAVKHQFCVTNVSNAAINTGVGQLLVELKKHLGGKHTTSDKNDLRGIESTDPELR